MEKAKRVRRNFACILTDKVTKKFTGKVSEASLETAKTAIEKVCETLQAEIKTAKKAAQKAKRRSFNVLKKFSKEELQNYIDKL